MLLGIYLLSSLVILICASFIKRKTVVTRKVNARYLTIDSLSQKQEYLQSFTIPFFALTLLGTRGARLILISSLMIWALKIALLIMEDNFAVESLQTSIEIMKMHEEFTFYYFAVFFLLGMLCVSQQAVIERKERVKIGRESENYVFDEIMNCQHTVPIATITALLPIASWFYFHPL